MTPPHVTGDDSDLPPRLPPGPVDDERIQPVRDGVGPLLHRAGGRPDGGVTVRTRRLADVH